MFVFIESSICGCAITSGNNSGNSIIGSSINGSSINGSSIIGSTIGACIIP